MTLPDAKRLVERILRHAIYLAEWKHATFAAKLGISETHCAKQIAGLEHLSLQRLAQLDQPEDRVFWLVLLTEFKRHFSIADTTSPEIANALSLLIESVAKHVEVRQLRMAKASLPEGQQERRRSA